MSRTKKYTKAEKIKVLKEAKKNEVKVTLEKYDLYPASFYYWKKKYESMGAEGMDHGMTTNSYIVRACLPGLMI